jgi:hypothetical protein
MAVRKCAILFLAAAILAASVNQSKAICINNCPVVASSSAGAIASVAVGVIATAAVLCVYDIWLKMRGLKNWDGTLKSKRRGGPAIYQVRIDASGNMNVVFSDGTTGPALPPGNRNVPGNTGQSGTTVIVLPVGGLPPANYVLTFPATDPYNTGNTFFGPAQSWMWRNIPH